MDYTLFRALLSMINTKLIYANIFAFAAFTIFFILFPKLDIQIANYFYDPKLDFLYKTNVIVQMLYMIYLYLKHKKSKLILKSSAFFLFITAIRGPGLIVNTVLKGNFGRARNQRI